MLGVPRRPCVGSGTRVQPLPRGTELPSSDLSASSADWPPSEPLPDFEGDACPVAPEISGGAIECAAAQAVVDECEGAVAPVEMAFRYGGGTIEWARVSSAYAGNAVTSAELDLGPEVLSCGDNDNGIDIDAFMKDLKREAEAGWGFAVTSIACRPGLRRLHLVEMPVGQAVASCAAYGGDSANGWAYVSVTENEPFYELGLGGFVCLSRRESTSQFRSVPPSIADAGATPELPQAVGHSAASRRTSGVTHPPVEDTTVRARLTRSALAVKHHCSVNHDPDAQWTVTRDGVPGTLSLRGLIGTR